MTERPLLMTGDMAYKAFRLLKTQTRRTKGLEKVNDQPDIWKFDSLAVEGDKLVACFTFNNSTQLLTCPYGTLGDRLWLRESWYTEQRYDDLKPINVPDPAKVAMQVGYRADHRHLEDELPDWAGRSRSAIHIPRWICRTVVEITEVRVQRLQSITELDAAAEGGDLGRFKIGKVNRHSYELERKGFGTHVDGFRYIWCVLHGAAAWAMNPWVWAITFTKL